MRRIYDSKHQEREIKVGAFVHLKLQPYRELAVATRKTWKLPARFYGPTEALERIGNVAYELKLPLASKIHPRFSCFNAKRKGW